MEKKRYYMNLGVEPLQNVGVLTALSHPNVLSYAFRREPCMWHRVLWLTLCGMRLCQIFARMVPRPW
jgi:hypothetical protein